MQRMVEIKKEKTPIISLLGEDSEPELRADFIKKIKRREKNEPVEYDF